MIENFWIISAPGWLLKKKSETTHGNMNVKYVSGNLCCIVEYVSLSSIVSYAVNIWMNFLTLTNSKTVA